MPKKQPNKPQQAPDLPFVAVTTKQATELLGLSREYLRKRIKDGSGPPVRYFGRSPRFLYGELLQWAKDQPTKPSN